jgi:hypothetical protein
VLQATKETPVSFGADHAVDGVAAASADAHDLDIGQEFGFVTKTHNLVSFRE